MRKTKLIKKVVSAGINMYVHKFREDSFTFYSKKYVISEVRLILTTFRKILFTMQSFGRNAEDVSYEVKYL